MPADVAHGRLTYVNGTRQFKSVIRYKCGPGYVLVGRAELMCDVDQRWNGPPPRCEPVYCDEPRQIRYGGFSLSTNSTRFGTVVSYYCTSQRHELVGPKKITCLKDGSYNAEAPRCRELGGGAQLPDILPPLAAVPSPKLPRTRRPSKDESAQSVSRVRVRKPFLPGTGRPRDKFSPDKNSYEPARAPIDNEIPDSANVQNSPAAGADVPQPVEGGQETRQAQLNLGEWN